MSVLGGAAASDASQARAVAVSEIALEPSGAVTRVLTSEADFDALRPAWNRLFASSRNHTPFQSWEWNRTWWRHFGSAADLRLYVVEQAGELIGIAPLHLRRRMRGWRLPSLAFISHGRADYLDFLVQPEKEVPFFAALFAHLRDQKRPEWRLLDLRDLPSGSSNLQPLLQRALHASFLLTLQPAEACVTVPLRPSWESYLASLGKNARRNVGRYRRQLAEDFKVEWFIPRTEPEFQRAFDDFVMLYRERWRATNGITLFDRPASLAFERDACHVAAQAGWGRLYLLYADSAPVAGYLGYVCNGKYYAGLLAYSPAFNRYSVGSTLIGMAIEDCISHHWTEVDMMRGDESFKYQWNGVRKCNYTARLSLHRTPLSVAGSIDWAFAGLTRVKALHRLRALWRRWRASAAADAGAHAAPATGSSRQPADTTSRPA